jgi:anti-sigma B factor antagonist
MHEMWEQRAGVGLGLHVGDRVEVATRFTGTWATGFEVAAVTAAGYRIRRLSDRTVLPIAFGHDDVRPEQRVPDVNLPRETAVEASVVVRFPAELDMQTVDAVAPGIMHQVDNARGEVVLDLDGVQFLDTSGIRLLMQVRRSAWERDVPVRLQGGKPIVRALLDLLGVDPLFVPDSAYDGPNTEYRMPTGR